MSVTTSSKGALLKVRKYVYEWRGSPCPHSDQGSASGPRSPLSTAAQRALTVLPPLLLGAILLAAWYLSTASGKIAGLILPTPGDVLGSLGDGLRSGVLPDNAWITMEESLLGFALAVVLALPLGYGIAKSRLLASALQPYLAAGQAIPAIVIAPLLIIWFGYGLLPKVMICMLVVLFPMVINTLLGIRTIDPALTDAARVEGASGWYLLADIEFPLALPAILAAVRTGLVLSIVGAVVGEFVSSGDKGLGSLVLQATNQYNTPFLFATLVMLTSLAALYYGAAWLLTKVAEAVY